MKRLLVFCVAFASLMAIASLFGIAGPSIGPPAGFVGNADLGSNELLVNTEVGQLQNQFVVEAKIYATGTTTLTTAKGIDTSPPSSLVFLNQTETGVTGEHIEAINPTRGGNTCGNRLATMSLFCPAGKISTA